MDVDRFRVVWRWMSYSSWPRASGLWWLWFLDVILVLDDDYNDHDHGWWWFWIILCSVDLSVAIAVWSRTLLPQILGRPLPTAIPSKSSEALSVLPLSTSSADLAIRFAEDTLREAERSISKPPKEMKLGVDGDFADGKYPLSLTDSYLIFRAEAGITVQVRTHWKINFEYSTKQLFKLLRNVQKVGQWLRSSGPLSWKALPISFYYLERWSSHIALV